MTRPEDTERCGGEPGKPAWRTVMLNARHAAANGPCLGCPDCQPQGKRGDAHAAETEIGPDVTEPAPEQSGAGSTYLGVQARSGAAPSVPDQSREWPDRVYVAVAIPGTDVAELVTKPLVSLEPGQLAKAEPDQWEERPYIPEAEAQARDRLRAGVREEVEELRKVAPTLVEPAERLTLRLADLLSRRLEGERDA